MGTETRSTIVYQTLELGGERYAVVAEARLIEVCRAAEIGALPVGANRALGLQPADLDGQTLAHRLAARRRRAGLTQADLAQRAGIRPETVNRIERGRTEPDFATVRKLVIAIGVAEHKEIGNDTCPVP